MNLYKDTSNTPKAPQRATREQNNGNQSSWKRVTIHAVINIILLLIVLAFIPTCQPVYAINYFSLVASIEGKA